MAALLGFIVSPNSGVPIYRQIVEQIRAQVAGGRLEEGVFLPSVRQVAEELAVNPMTISKAYSILEREGTVELIRGQGMRVKDPGPAGNGKARKQALMPLLQQVALTARLLNLSPQQVISALKPLLEDKS
ncbi:MAG TPA: GntR family transcriptional regulator [Tepidisphaeraceae bacterium]|jgi:GntR family transcriptional regulator